MTEQPNSPTPFQIEHRGRDTAAVPAWYEVGAISMDGEFPSARDALTTWGAEQSEEPPLGRYRVIDRFGYITEFDVREHRERVIERVERQAPATYSDGSRDGMTRSLDVLADALAAPGATS
jgi:hypothetical protein